MKESLKYINERVNDDPQMLEDELYEVLVSSGFFKKLGYKKFGKDVRAQYVVAGKRKKADYICRDEYQNVVFVLEAKRPSDRNLRAALSQLWHRYVLPLKAYYGVLTNGMSLIIYGRIAGKPEPVLTLNLAKVTDKGINLLLRTLRKPEYDITLNSKLEEYFSSVEKLSLKTDLAKENFFETFMLNMDSVFGVLICDLAELFSWVYPKSRFLKGAYGFWRRSFARKPDKVPESWKPFLRKDKDIFKFMFCLETAHALLARLMLAKACEDLEFPGISISSFITQKIQHVRGRIPLVAYPLVLMRLLREMRGQLVESIFEEDIFSWWSDGFVEFKQKSSAELLRKKIDMQLERFSVALANVILILYKYDFSKVAGDPLGDLYQTYFDKDTRKALGEFYTPVEVVKYILDAVDYRNVRYKRLLDPACGSGTFLVEALRRYVEEAKPRAKKEGWAAVLRELCNSPRIVGLDIHPFACLIAQVRFMLELMPYYKEALEQEKAIVYTLQRLPIFRTDSLVIEMESREFTKKPSLIVTEKDLKFTLSLPIEIHGKKSLSVTITIPSWTKTASDTQHMLYNLEEYFCAAQAMFDAVKDMASVNIKQIPTKGLEAHLMKYLTKKDFEMLAEFFKPYGDRILKEIYHLQSEFGDGRLIKSIEDTVLAALLKNYLSYDFVVGNPPYLNIRIIKRMVGKEVEAHYKARYKTARGLYDLYCLFVEKGLNVLSKNGALGYICSDQFMLTDYGKHLRHLLTEKNCKIDHILDLRDSGVFQDVVNYPCIIVLGKTNIKEEIKANTVKFVRVFKPMDKLLDDVWSHFKEDNHWANAYDMFGFPQSELDENTWKIMPDLEKGIFNSIDKEANASFGQLTQHIFVGTQTSADNIYLVFITQELGNELVRVRPQKSQKEYVIEKSILKPLLKGKDVTKWVPNWSKHWLIFPYKKRKLMSQNELQREYPHAWAYFLEFKNILEERESGKMKDRSDWYGYIYPKNHDKFEQIKLMTQLLSTNNRFALDQTSKFYFIAVGGDCITLKENHTDLKSYLYVLGLLNSKVLEYYLKHISPVHSGGFYLYIKQYLRDLPIKLPSTKMEKETAESVVQKVEKILQQIDPKRLLEDFPDAFLHEYLSKGVEIDEVEYTFDLDHSELKPFISGLPGKGYVVYPTKDEDSIWVDTKEKARYLVLTLRNRKVKQNQTVKILIPRDNSIVTDILKAVKKKVQEMKTSPINKLEEQINDLVYRLYSINEDDKVVIEDFLKKF